MTRSRFTLALLGATLSASAVAASPSTAPQPEFVPLRGKNPSQLDRAEKPVTSHRLGMTVRTEMRAVVGSDGQITFECHDASHAHSPARTLPARESK